MAARTRTERAAQAADESAQEKGDEVTNKTRVARTYVNATHPDTDLEVTFVPGEALPDWVKVKDGDLG